MENLDNVMKVKVDDSLNVRLKEKIDDNELMPKEYDFGIQNSS